MNIEPNCSQNWGNINKKLKVDDVKPQMTSVVDDKKECLLTVDKMIENVMKTKDEISKRKLSVARSWLSLKKGKFSKKITIDVNLNINK